MTLIELVLALTLFSTLLGSVGSLLTSGVRSQRNWGVTLGPYQQMERGFLRLERDLASAQPFFGLPCTADGERMEFARVESGQWVRVLYTLAEEAGAQWVVRETFVWAGPDDGEPLQREPLLRLTSGALAFGMIDPQGQLTWVSAWDGVKDGVPRLVKLDVEMASSSGQTPLVMSRVFRNPAGNLPTVEEAP